MTRSSIPYTCLIVVSSLPLMLQGDLPTWTMTAERPFLQIGLKLEILPSLRTIQRNHGTA